MRTASTSIPHWIDAPLESPLPPDSPILARWSAVRNCLPPLAELSVSAVSIGLKKEVGK